MLGLALHSRVVTGTRQKDSLRITCSSGLLIYCFTLWKGKPLQLLLVHIWNWYVQPCRIFTFFWLDDDDSFDTVGWVIWPAKTVPEMTYNVFSGTLNPTHFTSLDDNHHYVSLYWVSAEIYVVQEHIGILLAAGNLVHSLCKQIPWDGIHTMHVFSMVNLAVLADQAFSVTADWVWNSSPASV